MCDPPRIYPSLPEYTPLFNQFICATLPESTPPSQNIPPFQQQYATLPESTPPSRNIPLFNKCILCATLQEYTCSSLNIPPFSTTICDPPRIYPSLSEYTPHFSTNVYVRPSQNIPLPPSLPPRIHLPFQKLNATFPESTPLSTTIILCDAPKIYSSLPEYTPPPFSTTIYDPPILYPSLPKYTHFSTTILFYDAPRIYPSLHLSQNIPPPLSTTICDTYRNYPSLREYPPPFSDNYMPPSLPDISLLTFLQLYAIFQEHSPHH